MLLTDSSIVNRQSSIVNSPYLIITAIYVLSILIVDPRGEFPLNDDWSYTRSAFRWGQEGRMQVDEWCAMSLIGQALYGGLLTRLFGQSFLVLRLSTLALSCGTALLLWHILRQTGVRRDTAWVAVLGWIFNPIQFSLSHTYMTEVPFLFFATLGLAFYLAHIQNDKGWLLVGCASALGYCFLIRQTAVFFMAPVFLALLVRKDKDGWPAILRRTALFSFTTLLFIGTYYLWLIEQGGATPATRRKFELLSHISLEQIVGNLFGLLFYTSFMLLPLLIWLLPTLHRFWRESAGPVRVFSLILWIVFSAFGLSWFYLRYSHSEYLMSRAFHARMPFLLNLLYDTGLGPLTLDPTYYGPPPTPVYPRPWILVTLMVATGLVVLGLLLGLSRIWRRIHQKADRSLLFVGALSFLLIAAFEIIFSHLQEGGLFDRHILIAVLPLIPVLGILERFAAQAAEAPRPKLTGAASGTYLALAALAYFSLTATHDYLQWNRIRWDFGTELLAQRVDPLTVSAGFEFNGWHNYDTFRARGGIGGVYHWWYDKRVYLITMEPHPGYGVVARREYFSWLHRRFIPLYVLKHSSE
jgi:4-amino-4-deoxy-L-arabinose transferase-like glycosyltransferase